MLLILGGALVVARARSWSRLAAGTTACGQAVGGVDRSVALLEALTQRTQAS